MGAMQTVELTGTKWQNIPSCCIGSVNALVPALPVDLSIIFKCACVCVCVCVRVCECVGGFKEKDPGSYAKYQGNGGSLREKLTVRLPDGWTSLL